MTGAHDFGAKPHKRSTGTSLCLLLTAPRVPSCTEGTGGRVWRHFQLSLQGGAGVLLAPSRWGPGMLLHVLRCTGQPCDKESPAQTLTVLLEKALPCGTDGGLWSQNIEGTTFPGLALGVFGIAQRVFKTTVSETLVTPTQFLWPEQV